MSAYWHRRQSNWHLGLWWRELGQLRICSRKESFEMTVKGHSSDKSHRLRRGRQWSRQGTLGGEVVNKCIGIWIKRVNWTFGVWPEISSRYWSGYVCTGRTTCHPEVRTVAGIIITDTLFKSSYCQTLPSFYFWIFEQKSYFSESSFLSWKDS